MTRTISLASLAVLVSGCVALTALADNPKPPPPGYIAIRDLDYSGRNNPRQKLDLYVTEKRPEKPVPLLIYIHGGGWEAGSKDDAAGTLTFAAKRGWAGASIGYRLTDEARWPAQIHDVKAALRWIKAHAKEHMIDEQKIALYGISAGGHLVSLLGTSSDVKELDGDVGKPGDLPKVACVADFAGPADFLTFPGKGSIIDSEKPGSAVTKLFGGPMSQHLTEAKAASPVTYVTKDDPPFLIIHGTADNLVPYDQATEFDEALRKAGVASTLLTGKGAPHVFFTQELIDKMQTFFDHYLEGKSEMVKSGTLSSN